MMTNTILILSIWSRNKDHCNGFVKSVLSNLHIIATSLVCKISRLYNLDDVFSMSIN